MRRRRGTDIATAQQSLDQFLALLTNLSWLQSANPFASFAQTVDLGGLTLQLGGSVSGSDVFLGWDSAIAPDGGPLPGGVHVRQISAVLNIGFATSDTGNNVVVAINGSGADSTVKGASVVAHRKVASDPTVLAKIVTGNANAVGNMASVTVCQSFNDGIACAPKVVTHPTGGGDPASHPTRVTLPAAAASRHRRRRVDCGIERRPRGHERGRVGDDAAVHRR